MRPEEKPYTYTLAYPKGFISDAGTDMGGKVFYVGKGRGKRIFEHEKRAFLNRLHVTAGKQDKNKIIREIVNRGFEVEKRKVKEFETDEEAYQNERELIKFYGLDNLTNIRSEDRPVESLNQHTENRKLRLRVKQIAAAKGFNQAKLTRAVGVDIKTIQSIFRDPNVDIKVSTLDKIAQVLGVDIRDLMYVEE